MCLLSHVQCHMWHVTGQVSHDIIIPKLLERVSNNKKKCSTSPVCQVSHVTIYFHRIGPLGQFGLVVKMTVCVYVYIFICPLPMQLFTRPLIGPRITWSVWGLSLVTPPSLPYCGGGGRGDEGWGGGVLYLFNFFFNLFLFDEKHLWRGRQRWGRGRGILKKNC